MLEFIIRNRSHDDPTHPNYSANVLVHANGSLLANYRIKPVLSDSTSRFPFNPYDSEFSITVIDNSFVGNDETIIVSLYKTHPNSDIKSILHHKMKIYSQYDIKFPTSPKTKPPHQSNTNLSLSFLSPQPDDSSVLQTISFLSPQFDNSSASLSLSLLIIQPENKSSNRLRSSTTTSFPHSSPCSVSSTHKKFHSFDVELDHSSQSEIMHNSQAHSMTVSQSENNPVHLLKPKLVFQSDTEFNSQYNIVSVLQPKMKTCFKSKTKTSHQTKTKISSQSEISTASLFPKQRLLTRSKDSEKSFPIRERILTLFPEIELNFDDEILWKMKKAFFPVEM